VTVLATLGNPDHGVVAIREISFPGLSLGRDLAVPDAGATGQTGFVFSAQPERRACVRADFGPTCEAGSFRPSEEESGLYRTFHTDDAGEWSISGEVTARAAPETAQLLWPIGGAVKVGASSVLTDDPSVSGQFAFDGDASTSWLSARGDLRPSLVLRWDRPRTLTRLRVLPAQGLSRTPVVAEIESGADRRRVDLGANAFGLFAPLRTDQVTISFPMPPATGDAATLPVGVGDVVIDGLKNLTYAPDKSARTGAICGLGPDVVVDGQTVHTRVTGTLGDVIGGSSLQLEPCGGAVHLSAGDHELAVASTDRFLPTTLTMLPTGRSLPAQAQTRTRTTDIKKWQSTSRAVAVGPGAEALLRVPENVNAGWQATLNGRVLASTRVDGWQQAYRIPAGDGGLVRLTYTPDRPYRAALLVGAIAAGLLLVGCLWVWRRERRMVLVAVDLPAAMSGSLRAGWGGVPLLVVAWLVGGVALLVGTLVGLLLRRRPEERRWLAVGVVGVVGIAAAVLTHVDEDVPWNVFDAATGGAIGLLLAGLTSAPARED
jgi:arabinofuranan 3-O-arabinosyltransferase